MKTDGFLLKPSVVFLISYSLLNASIGGISAARLAG